MTLTLTGTGATAVPQTTAELPRYVVRIISTNPVADGTVVNCNTVADAQAVFDDGGAGGAKRILMRRSAAELTGSAPLTIKDRGGSWTELSYQGAVLTPNTRFAPSQFQALQMPIFSCHALPGYPVLDASYGGVRNVYINGVGFRGSGITGAVYPVVSLGGANADPPTMAAYNSRILMNQCVVWLANPTADQGVTGDGAICGIGAEAHNVEIAYCWIQGIRHPFFLDTQAVRVSYGPGALRVHHSFLESLGENFATGGSNPLYPRLMYDLTSEFNHLYKRPSWMADANAVQKNSVEYKQGIRARHRYDIMENCRKSQQFGQGFQLWSCDQSSDGRRDMQTTDFTAEYCWVKKHSMLGIVTSRHDSNPSATTRRVRIANCVMTGQGYWDGAFPMGHGIRINENRAGVEPNGPDYLYDIDIQHNTNLLPAPGAVGWMVIGVGSQKMHGVRIRDNLGGVDNGAANVLFCYEAGRGQPAWDQINGDHDCEWLRNALVKVLESTGRVNDDGTNKYYATTAALKMVDSSVAFNAAATLSDLSGLKLASDSTAKGFGQDGTDPGADIDSIQSVMSAEGVETNPALLPA